MKNRDEILAARAELFSFALSDICPEDIRQHIICILPSEYFNGVFECNETPFFARYPFQADFIGYWQCEVCYDIYGKSRLKAILDHREIRHS